MISKKRYWGLALPIYPCEACGTFEVIGSEVELQERAVEGWDEFEGHSPHRPWVDAVKIACPDCGAVVSRIPDVGNPWLDAGIVPLLDAALPQTTGSYWREWFPADFITESFPGQFRNWFYSMLVMAAALEDAAPFKTLLGFGTLMDEKGEEFHKSKGNSIPFDEAAAIVGADTMRWLFAITQPSRTCASRASPRRGGGGGARGMGSRRGSRDLWLQARAPLDKLWNVYSFFVTYANIDGFNPTTRSLPVSRAQRSRPLGALRAAGDDPGGRGRLVRFDTQRAGTALSAFIENLSNWYVRLSRRRFWKS